MIKKLARSGNKLQTITWSEPAERNNRNKRQNLSDNRTTMEKARAITTIGNLLKFINGNWREIASQK
jgi:hypothetical protein